MPITAQVPIWGSRFGGAAVVVAPPRPPEQQTKH